MGVTSLWIEEAPGREHAPLATDLRADIAVVGGGIAGIVTAYLLATRGHRVALIEARRLAEGTTGHTTAKLTSQHGMLYADLMRRHGADAASTYAQAQEAAIWWVRSVVAEIGLECDLERTATYLYAEDEADVEELADEAMAAAGAGLPARLIDHAPVPFPTAVAVEQVDQALFHPRRFLFGLTERLPELGAVVCERSPVRAVDVSPEGCRLAVSGAIVSCDHVVLATLLPIRDDGLLFARVAPYTEYVLALEPGGLDEDAVAGALISATDPARSMRWATGRGGRLLLLAGERHKTGQEADPERRLQRLQRWGRSRLGTGGAVYRWSAHDQMSADRLPLAGAIRSGRLWAMTGFGAWGMTNGIACATAIADAIEGSPSPFGRLVDPARTDVSASARSLVSENVNVARTFVRGHLRGTTGDDPAAVAPGEATVLDLPGGRAAVHREPSGRLHVVSASCTHLGCVVAWNATERSWDCPCHGSRFAPDGTVVSGPAFEPLADHSAVEARR
jgi:glycine/D-amino acid oxidase-like deaminating enzyme/nitrite reductase/ring-hydroxylating ferredoxin subunit